VATSVAGTVQVQSGNNPVRPLRQGDEVVQGDTITTAAASSVVLKFDDGQVAALTSNSKMTITTYTYVPESQTGSVFLSLVTGGMRAITGLIGKKTPNQVAYRAATATIGIRGSDVIHLTFNGSVLVSVTEHAVTFTHGGETLTITEGNAIFMDASGKKTRITNAELLSKVPAAFKEAFTEMQALGNAIIAAAPGIPRGDRDHDRDDRGHGQQGHGGNQGGGGGGGNASGH
jgi:hypothetical protein